MDWTPGHFQMSELACKMEQRLGSRVQFLCPVATNGPSSPWRISRAAAAASQETALQLAIGGRSTAARTVFEKRHVLTGLELLHCSGRLEGPNLDQRCAQEPLEKQPSFQRHPLRWWLRSSGLSANQAVRQV